MEKISSLPLSFDRFMVQILTPGFVAVLPYSILFLKYKGLYHTGFLSNTTITVLVFLFFIILIGMLLENFGSRIEVWILDKNSVLYFPSGDFDKNWNKYLMLNFGEIEPNGQDYLRSILLRMKFELSMGIAMLLLASGLYILNSEVANLHLPVEAENIFKWKVLKWLPIVCSIYLFYEALGTSLILGKLRANFMLNYDSIPQVSSGVGVTYKTIQLQQSNGYVVTFGNALKTISRFLLVALIFLSPAILYHFFPPVRNKSAIACNISINGKLFTSTFQQKAAEYKALCFQSYNIAKLQLDQKLLLKKNKKALPPAIITDVDETILDNSPYAVRRSLEGKEYEQESWIKWTNEAKCDTVPGALSFLKYASANHVEIFYITNRSENEKGGTLNNLLQFGFPNADHSHLVMKGNESSKEARRQEILKQHNVILYLGDNLADFSNLFDNKKTISERAGAVNEISGNLGNNFIVIPNADYGDWEAAIYGYNYGMTQIQKDSSIKAIVHSY